MSPYGSLCVLTGLFASLWVFIAYYVSLCVLMGLYGTLIVFMRLYGF